MRYLNILLIFMLAVLQYDLWVGDGSMAAVWKLQHAISDQQTENTRLKARNDTLTAEVKDLKSGLSAIEERARSELGMIKKDETFIQTVDSTK
jgi:cell division protein FtsB